MRFDIDKIKKFLYILIIFLFGCSGIIFSVLYFNSFNSGLFNDYSGVFIALSVGIISALTVLSIIFFGSNKRFIYRLFFLIIVFYFFVVFSLYLLKKFGFFEKISSAKDLREYISSFGGFAVIIFILIQFLQVVILPIPSFITVGAGVLLFGPLKGAIFSFIGIVTGSFVAFFIGRILGFKVTKWLVGEAELLRGLKLLNGKDKVILTFMFLFPFFPDDVLCFVAGITTISPVYFSIMITITRLISIFVSAYSLNNSIIPYNTWWGILIWGLLVILVIVATIIIYKNGDKIENFFKKKKM